MPEHPNRHRLEGSSKIHGQVKILRETLQPLVQVDPQQEQMILRQIFLAMSPAA